MRTFTIVLALALLAKSAFAETVVAKRTIRAHSVITSADVGLSQEAVAGGLSDVSAALGQETRVMIYAGRPLLASDLGPPAVVDRNQIVTLLFRKGGLTIATEGRSMSRAAAGEAVRAVNLQSRLSVTGRVSGDGTVFVTGSDPLEQR